MDPCCLGVCLKKTPDRGLNGMGGCVWIHCVAQRAHFNQGWVNGIAWDMREQVMFAFAALRPSVTMHVCTLEKYIWTSEVCEVCVCACARMCAWNLISKPLVYWLSAPALDTASKTPDLISNGFLLLFPPQIHVHTHAHTGFSPNPVCQNIHCEW